MYTASGGSSVLHKCITRWCLHSLMGTSCLAHMSSILESWFTSCFIVHWIYTTLYLVWVEIRDGPKGACVPPWSMVFLTFVSMNQKLFAVWCILYICQHITVIGFIGFFYCKQNNTNSVWNRVKSWSQTWSELRNFVSENCHAFICRIICKTVKVAWAPSVWMEPWRSLLPTFYYYCAHIDILSPLAKHSGRETDSWTPDTPAALVAVNEPYVECVHVCRPSDVCV